MAHKDTVIEPAEGLTVLVGPNNCGKSAVVEALMVLATNSSKDFMIRHGEKDCQIIIETGEGHQIEWRRTGGTVSYQLDGRPIHRVRSGDVPDNLHDLLRLPDVPGPDGKDAFAVHFGTQKEPIFLLDRSGRHTATFFAASSDASHLVAMQMAHKRNVADRRRDERALVEHETQLSRSLESLQPLAALLETLDALDSDYEGLRIDETAIKAREHAIAALNRAFAEVICSEARAGALGKLQPPPALEDTASLERSLAGLRAARRTVAFESGRGRAMEPLNPPPSLQEISALESTCKRLARQEIAVDELVHKWRCLTRLISPPVLELAEPLENLSQRLRSQHAHLERLRTQAQIAENIPAPPTMFDLESLNNTVKQLQIADKRVAAISERVLSLGNIPNPVELPDPGPLSFAVDRLRSAHERVKEETSNLKRTNAALDETYKSIQEWAETHPFCPTCGARIDPEQFVVEGGHEHAA